MALHHHPLFDLPLPSPLPLPHPPTPQPTESSDRLSSTTPKHKTRTYYYLIAQLLRQLSGVGSVGVLIAFLAFLPNPAAASFLFDFTHPRRSRRDEMRCDKTPLAFIPYSIPSDGHNILRTTESFVLLHSSRSARRLSLLFLFFSALLANPSFFSPSVRRTRLSTDPDSYIVLLLLLLLLLLLDVMSDFQQNTRLTRRWVTRDILFKNARPKQRSMMRCPSAHRVMMIDDAYPPHIVRSSDIFGRLVPPLPN